MEINGINLLTNTSLIEEILIKEFNEIYQQNDSFDQYKISPEQKKQIVEALNSIVQYKLSLRRIKCLLGRIKRFHLEEDHSIN